MRKCPKCGVKYKSHPAISRRDNKTEICPPCGAMEALKDFDNYISNKEFRNQKNEGGVIRE